MLKNFVFSALFLNLVATYLSFKQIDKQKNRLPLLFTIVGLSLFIAMIILTINLFFSSAPLLLNSPILLGFLITLGTTIELYSLYKKMIPGQLIAASIFLFLVYPTIFSIGILLLIIVIIELTIALIVFQKTRRLGF